jgi:hypothetical protein
MKTLTTLAALVLLHLSASAQFQLRYSTKAYDWPAALDIDKKDGYIIAGQTLLGPWHPSLMRVDVNGAVQWSYTYNQPGIDEHFWDVTAVDWTPEPLYAAVGNADGVPGTSLGWDEYFLLVESNGKPISVRRYLTEGGDVANHIEAIKHPHYGNGFVITGWSTFAQDQDINIVLTDRSGNLLKSAVFRTPLNQKPYHVEFTHDGGFIIIGETQLKETCDKKDVNVIVIRLNSELKVQWSYTYDFIPEEGTSDDRAYAVKEDANDEIHIVGTSRLYAVTGAYHEEPFQLHLKSDGSPVWLRGYNVDTYPSADVVSFVNKKTSKGIINVLAGRTHQNFEALLFETDTDGKPTWARTYPANYSLSSTRAEDLTENEINGYSFTGRAFNAQAPSTGYDIHLVKTDGNGKSGEPCEKEVDILSHRVKLCQEKINFDITTMREVRISVDPVKLDLKVNKCEDNASSSVQPPVTPNPGENFITIAGYEDGSRVAVFDPQGLLKKTVTYSGDTRIDVAELPAGIYVIEVTTADGVITKYRFIKN